MMPQGHAQADTQSSSRLTSTTEVKFPKTLWKDVRLSQRFMALDNMGEKWVILKVDGNNVLSL